MGPLCKSKSTQSTLLRAEAFILLGGDLTAGIVFSSLAMFDIIQIPINLFLGASHGRVRTVYTFSKAHGLKETACRAGKFVDLDSALQPKP